MVPGMVQDGSDMVPKRFGLTNTLHLQGFAMIPGMVQDGSDRVPQRLDLTIASYLQGFAMVPGMLQEGSDMLPQRFVVRVREKSFLFVRWRLFLRAACTNYENVLKNANQRTAIWEDAHYEHLCSVRLVI